MSGIGNRYWTPKLWVPNGCTVPYVTRHGTVHIQDKAPQDANKVSPYWVSKYSRTSLILSSQMMRLAMYEFL